MLLKLMQKTKKDLFGTIVFMKRAPSHFSPYAAGIVYKYFNAKKVFDPYAGWGDRCLAAICLDIDYVGVDSNEKLKVPFKKLISKFNHSSNIKFISDKSENVILTALVLVYPSLSLVVPTISQG